MASKKTTKAAPTKKTAPSKGKPQKLSKSEFIRKHPKMPAKEVVALAKKAGMTIGVNFVYTIRSAAKGKGTSKAADTAGTKKTASPSSSKKVGSKAPSNKSQFIRDNASLPVKEIIAKAAKSGVGVLSPAFCYTIISEFRKKQGTSAPAKGQPKATPTGKPSPKATGAEAELERLVKRIGTDQAQTVFKRVLERVLN